MPTVAVLSHHRHPRLRYVLRELSSDLGYKFRLFTDAEHWAKTEAEARIGYGHSITDLPALLLPAHSFVSGRHPKGADLEVAWQEGQPRFFATEQGYDLLACIFYTLSRYEEYQPFTPDQHERFPASESHALRNNYLHFPVVRSYAQSLAGKLCRMFPNLPPPKQHPFHLQPSYDIDLLWAYRYRGWKGTASGLRDAAQGKLDRAKDRFLRASQQDPYFHLDHLLSLHPDSQPHIFWLLADNERREDVNPYPIPQEQEEFMRSLVDRAKHGIHPGYATTETNEKLKKEIARYRKVFGLVPAHSRQHFLRLRFPATYRALRQHGITNDHSMGYGDAPGWRAGTNLPFHWYDLEQETMTGLTVHPFGVMDVTLKNYLGLEPEAAKERLGQLQNDLSPFGGPFTTLWHNSSFAEAYGWAGWREVYESLFQAE